MCAVTCDVSSVTTRNNNMSAHFLTSCLWLHELEGWRYSVGHEGKEDVTQKGFQLQQRRVSSSICSDTHTHSQAALHHMTQVSSVSDHDVVKQAESR